MSTIWKLVAKLLGKNALVPGMIGIEQDGHSRVFRFSNGDGHDRFDFVVVSHSVYRALARLKLWASTSNHYRRFH